MNPTTNERKHGPGTDTSPAGATQLQGAGDHTSSSSHSDAAGGNGTPSGVSVIGGLCSSSSSSELVPALLSKASTAAAAATCSPAASTTVAGALADARERTYLHFFPNPNSSGADTGSGEGGKWR